MASIAVSPAHHLIYWAKIQVNNVQRPLVSSHWRNTCCTGTDQIKKKKNLSTAHGPTCRSIECTPLVMQQIFS